MKKHIFLVGALVVATLAVTVLVACGSLSSPAGGRPTLVYFRASNCPYCKQMTPVVNEIEKKYGKQLNVIYAEVEQQQGKELAKQYGIIGYPTMLLLDSEGERVGLLRGVVPLLSLEQMVDDLLAEES